MIEADERPVADRLEGVPIPAESEFLVGHQQAADRFVAAYHAGKLHHAWLVSGPRGIGKATFAFHLSKYILSNPRPDSSQGYRFGSILNSVHRQIAQGAHPDLLHLTRSWDSAGKRFKTQLSVDEIRKTQAFYGMTAGAGGWRITIVDPADDMNANAANALLKILEEPPKRSLFFVISHSPGRLLPTIRSRCQLLNLKPLTTQEVGAAIPKLGVEAAPEEIMPSAALAEGSLRQALQLLGGDAAKHFGRFEDVMKHGGRGSSEDWVAAHDVSDALARRGSEEAFHQFTDLVLGWIARQVRQSDTADTAALAGWVEVWDKANRSVSLANTFNLDRKQAVLNLFAAVFKRDKP